MATAYDQRSREFDESGEYGNDERSWRNGRAWRHEDERSGRDGGAWRSNEYGRRGQDGRGFFDRAGDEVRTWFGDEEAERRRRIDEYETERRGRQGRSWRSRLSPGDARAGDLMTRQVVTVSPQDPVEHAARLMRDFHCGALPVVDHSGRVVGMVTDRDIAMRLVASGIDVRRSIVADCMTGENFAGYADDSIWECVRKMSRHQIRRLPIVNDRGRVIGILSQGDLARYADAFRGDGERRQIAKLISEISAPSSAPYR